jgi:hypothetical protein
MVVMATANTHALNPLLLLLLLPDLLCSWLSNNGLRQLPDEVEHLSCLESMRVQGSEPCVSAYLCCGAGCACLMSACRLVHAAPWSCSRAHMHTLVPCLLDQ